MRKPRSFRASVIEYEVTNEPQALQAIVAMYLNSGPSEEAIEQLEAEIDLSCDRDLIYRAINDAITASEP